jgi:hypothetical protein
MPRHPGEAKLNLTEAKIRAPDDTRLLRAIEWHTEKSEKAVQRGHKWSQLPDLDFVPDSDTRKIRVFPLIIKNYLA